jgi:hypothetical protein
MILRGDGSKPHVLGRYAGRGSLVAAPMLDERSLYIATAGQFAQRPGFSALSPADIEHPTRCPIEWAFQ